MFRDYVFLGVSTTFSSHRTLRSHTDQIEVNYIAEYELATNEKILTSLLFEETMTLPQLSAPYPLLTGSQQATQRLCSLDDRTVYLFSFEKELTDILTDHEMK